MRYALDTNAVIAILNQPSGQISARLRQHPLSDFGVSAIVMHELWFGVFRSAKPEQNAARLEALRFSIMPLDLDDARAAGEIRARLARLGTPIGPYDVLIAGQALTRRLTLVTANTGEFARVEGLAVEDWALSPR